MRTKWQPRSEDDMATGPTYLGIGTVHAVADPGGPDDAPSLFLRVGNDWVEHVLLAEPVVPRRIGFHHDPE